MYHKHIVMYMKTNILIYFYFVRIFVNNDTLSKLAFWLKLLVINQIDK